MSETENLTETLSQEIVMMLAVTTELEQLVLSMSNGQVDYKNVTNYSEHIDNLLTRVRDIVNRHAAACDRCLKLVPLSNDHREWLEEIKKRQDTALKNLENLA